MPTVSIVLYPHVLDDDTRRPSIKFFALSGRFLLMWIIAQGRFEESQFFVAQELRQECLARVSY